MKSLLLRDRRTPPELEHVIEIVDVGDGGEDDKEWRLIHPPECPVSCYWFEGMDTPTETRAGEHFCYLQYEVDGIGLDGLDLSGAEDDWLADVDPRGEYAIAHDLDGWRRLRPGGYRVLGWHTPPYWAGDYIDADGGIELLGPAVTTSR